MALFKDINYTPVEIPEKDLIHSNSFVVMPKHTNYMENLIFGGHFMGELDLCCAVLTTKLVRYSPTANNAVTFKVTDLEFMGPSFVGDIIYMYATCTELRQKAIAISIRAERETRQSSERFPIAKANFVFVTRNDNTYCKHFLKLKET